MIIDMYVWSKVSMLAHTQINIFVKPDKIQKLKNSNHWTEILSLLPKTPAQRTLVTTLKQITDAKTESTHFLFYIPPQQSWSKKVLH